MKWSLKLGSYAGIGVYLHWTFILLILWIFLAYFGAGHSTAQAFAGVGFILALFACVVLHEFGHALMARHYGIKTRDITLLPIGGVARLEKIPEKPIQEFWVALAGPAVNVVIAGILFIWLSITNGLHPIGGLELGSGSLPQRLMVVNLFLVGFNLLPAFPMDGGRVLRAVLSVRMGRRRATAIAANIGQGMAILFALLGILYNPFLIFIAIFVYLGAQSEAGMVEMQSMLKGLRVRDAMMTNFRTLAPADTLDQAVTELIAGSQQDFPVVESGRPVGLLRRNDLVKALADKPRNTAVAEVMSRDCKPVEDSANLKHVVETMYAGPTASVTVIRLNKIVGLLTLENISEMIVIRTAVEKQTHLVTKNHH